MAKREIRFYKHYFNVFYAAQHEKVRRKITQVLVWLQTLDRLPVTILRKGFMKFALSLEEMVI